MAYNFEEMIVALGTMLFFLGLILYIYVALAMMTIAKKLKYKKPWLAWIPIANLFLVPILAKKDWPWGFIFFVPIVGTVFYFIWTWKIYELRKYPGWLSLIPLGAMIPLLGMGFVLAHLVIMGIVAWNDRK